MHKLFWIIARPIIVAIAGYGFIAPPLVSADSDLGLYAGLAVFVATTYGVVVLTHKAIKAIRRRAK